jgi:hypothetical protein
MHDPHDLRLTPEELWAFYREAAQEAIRGLRIAEAEQHLTDALRVAERFGPTDLRKALLPPSAGGPAPRGHPRRVGSSMRRVSLIAG